MNLMEFKKEALHRNKQKSLRLQETKKVLALWNELKHNDLHLDLRHEIWLLACACAKYEWGESTVLDDYSQENAVIVMMGTRKEIINMQ